MSVSRWRKPFVLAQELVQAARRPAGRRAAPLARPALEALEVRLCPVAGPTRSVVVNTGNHTGIRLDNVRAGDLVNIDVALGSNDSRESAENEPFVIRGWDNHVVYGTTNAYGRTTTISFRASIDAETVDAYFPDFDNDEAAALTVPTVFRPDYRITSVTRAADGGVNVGYGTGPLPISTNQYIDIELFWARGTTLNDVIGGPIGSAAGLTFAANATDVKHIRPDPTKGLPDPPAGATYLLAAINPANRLPESDTSNNVQAVALADFLPNYRATGLTVVDGNLRVTYEVSGAPTPHDENPVLAVVWAHEVTNPDGSKQVVKIGGTLPATPTPLMDKSPKTHSYEVALSRLSIRPAGATHLLLVLDYDRTVAEPSRADNTLSLQMLLQPGVYVAARDLNFGAGRIGTHQYLVLVPENPDLFPSARNLGDGTRGLIIGTHDVNGYLEVKTFESADAEAARDYLGALQTFHPEVARVDLTGPGIDATIAAIVRSADYYTKYESTHHIPYPGVASMLLGLGLNSNSWTQSIIEYVVGPHRVREHFAGNDLLYSKRIGREYFLP